MDISSSTLSSWIIAHERLTIALLVLVIVVLSFLFLIQPLLSGVQESDLLLAEQRLEEKRSRLERAKNSQETYARIATEEQKKLSYILPLEDDIPGLIVQLSSLTKANELVIQEIALGTAPSVRGAGSTTPSFLKEIPLSLRVTGGNYAILKKFLESLERHMRVMDVLSFDVSPDLASYAFVLRTYYLTSP